MDQFNSWLAPRWLGLTLVVAALLLGAVLLVLKRRRQEWSLPLLALAGAVALAGVGGLALPPFPGMIVALAGLGTLFGLLLWVILTGQWWPPLALVTAAVLFLGLGGWCAVPLGELLLDVGRGLRYVEAVQPAWLWLLLLIPWVIWLSYRSMAGLGPVRRWAAIGLRCSLILFLTLALAEVRVRLGNDTVTTLFLLDRSLSVPEEINEDDKPDPVTNRRPDRRWERVQKFINDAVEQRGDQHKRDRSGLIVFGRRPRLELPPSDAPRFNFTNVASNLDTYYTDIAAALKLALASFPEGSGKRVVLLSDGNENMGNAVEQALIAKNNGVSIDVVPLGAWSWETDAAGNRIRKPQRNQNEVLLQSVEVPPMTEQGSRFPIRVLIRSYNPRPVKGILELVQIVDGGDGNANAGPKEQHVAPSPWGDVILRPGLNSISFPPPKNRPKGSFTYKAKFIPQTVIMEDGAEKPAPVGRLQNKEASTHVLAMGQRRVLIVEGVKEENADALEHEFLAQHLRGIGNGKFQIRHIRSSQLPREKADLAVFLSNYDTVLLANVPAEQLTDEQQEIVRSNTYDQGCGLIMIGGPDSFGAGGWQSTAVEKALPVDCDIKAMKVEGKGGLVLVMHACEMSDGNMWQKKIAKLAIDKLGPLDMVGVLGLDLGGQKWQVDFASVGEKREAMKRQVDRMTPGDMPDFDSPLQMAYDKLRDPQYELTKKHVIIISDGDPQLTNRGLLTKMRAEKITVSTVGVATHGLPEDQQMLGIATATGGKYHKVASPRALPEIYTKEVRLVSQSFLYEKRFQPKLVFGEGVTVGLPEKLLPLYGFVRTTPKPAVTVSMPILVPPQGEHDFPVLALWQYGLGKSAAFTSDARSGIDRRAWDRDWADSQMYQRFWEQVVDWSLRAVETGRLVMHSEYRDGKVKVTIDARDENNRPITDLTLRGGVTSPNPNMQEQRKFELKFEQKNSGQYEAEFKADEAGSYFVAAQPTRTVKKKVIENGKEVEREVKEALDSVRGGVTIPYSPEFADMESNVALLEKLRDLTGGITIDEDADSLKAAARNGVVFRATPASSRSLQPIWFWLVALAGVLLFFDVAVRRIAIEPSDWIAPATRFWQRLRGQAVAAPATPQFLDRLKSKKTEIGESLEKDRATTRFEATPGAPSAPPPPGADAAPPPAQRPPSSPGGVAPASGEDPADFASRLMKAKRRAMEDRDKK